MKLATVFGIASIFSLLSMTAILVLKQDSNRLLYEVDTFENAPCFRGQLSYDSQSFIPYTYNVWNICSTVERFQVKFSNPSIQSYEYCTEQDQDSLAGYSYYPFKAISAIQVKCDE
ncbi:hypothetical protein ABPG72_013899 [Tetrahymena utriculariae]